MHIYIRNSPHSVRAHQHVQNARILSTIAVTIVGGHLVYIVCNVVVVVVGKE